MDSVDNIHNTNDLIEKKSKLIDFLRASEIEEFENLNYSWTENELDVGSNAHQMLEENELTVNSDDKCRLTRAGRLFLSRILIQFPEVGDGGVQLGSKYNALQRLRVGKNSALYQAKHQLLDSKVVIKIIRPEASENIIQSLQLIGRTSDKASIVKPLDIFEIPYKDVFNTTVNLHCVVYPYLEGITLRQFLSQKSYRLNSHLAISFARQIGMALFELEKQGAYHGDLHDENILVLENKEGLIQFTLLDVSFGAMGSLSDTECRNSDLSNFRQHIWRILTLQKSFIPGMSLRKFLSTKQFGKIEAILSDQVDNFSHVMQVLQDDTRIAVFENKKSQFIEEKFGRPTTFRLQRYEEIVDASEAARLFVPFPELMSKVKDFGNIIIAGNRGSGKSTYLAALGFFPLSDTSQVDFREIFGIYFPCRQGEFKSIKGHSAWSEEQLYEFLNRIVVVKIIRRTLESIATAANAKKISTPLSLFQLRAFLNQFVPEPGITSVEHELLPELENLASTMVRVELQLLSEVKNASWNRDDSTKLSSLVSFFNIARSTFSELSATRFHILFDDAGAPNLTEQIQKILCDLILTSNSIYCVKFSAERFTFKLNSSDGKIPEVGHDYFEHDISQMLFIGSKTARLPRENLEQYFRKIVEVRLEYFNYQSHNITTYLGDNRNIANQLIGLLANRRSEASYAGWTAVWNIAERTPRNLLEIVSEIFAYADIDRNSKPKEVNKKIQDKAIRTISNKRLQSLSQVAGYIIVSGEKVSLGRALYEITSAIGSVFRTYLREEKGKTRKRQHLAIERNDFSSLSGEAQIILNHLISFGVLDDTKLEYARDDRILKPIYVLNRIYCPAFSIMFRRDEHLRLSQGRFETLLLDPGAFVKTGTKRLRDSIDSIHPTDDLFGFDSHE